MNKILVVGFAIIMVYLIYAPKELPKETFNISVNGETRYHAQIRQGECDRHIMTVRETLLLHYTLLEVQQILSQGIVSANCIKQEIPPKQ